MGVSEIALFLFASALVCAFGKELCEIDSVREETIRHIEDLQNEIGTVEWQYIAKSKNGTDASLIMEYKKICDGMESMKQPKVSDNALTSLWAWAVLEVETFGINTVYNAFRRLQKPDPPLYSKAWQDLTQIILKDSEKPSVLTSFKNLQNIIYSKNEGHKDIFEHAEEETYSQLCNIDQSPQQLIYNMYTLVQMTQLKAYTMIQFSWMLLRTYGKGNFTVESEMLRENYMARLEEQALAVQDTLKRASTSMWRCDPRKHVEGETYAEIKKLLQGFIVNEIDINKEHSCSEDCSYYKFTKQYGCYKNNLGCSTQPVCKGNVVKCKFVDSDMWVCKAPSSSKRRYDWIEYENGRVLGTKQRCKTSVNKVDSWWRYLFWHCSYCMCYCDDSGSHVTERIFSMKAVTTNKTENKVVVGMRFVKIKKIIYLQLKEAKLASKGGIDEDSAAWVPVKEIDIHDGTTKSGEDYFELSWEQRSMDLDNLELPKGQVLTGMKFRKIGSHLNMEIEGTEFNFTTGLLKNNGERSHWIGNDNTEKTLGNPRTEVILHNPDISVRDHAASKPDSGHNQFIKFDSTDLDLDAGQTAVPFIDIQPVVPSPMVPLSGAGIFHKGNRWYGGFIALKVFTHDFTQNIESNFPKIEGSK